MFSKACHRSHPKLPFYNFDQHFLVAYIWKQCVPLQIHKFSYSLYGQHAPNLLYWTLSRLASHAGHKPGVVC